MRVKFWSDWWVGSQPLIELATREVPLQFRSWTVSDVMDENGGWNLALLQDLLPAECLEEIRATPTSEIARRVSLLMEFFLHRQPLQLSLEMLVINKVFFLDMAVEMSREGEILSMESGAR